MTSHHKADGAEIQVNNYIKQQSSPHDRAYDKNLSFYPQIPLRC